MNSQPLAAHRGLLECFYGRHWSSTARRSALQAVAEGGGNFYVYGPAADLRTGADWRIAYSDTAAQEQDELIQHAQEFGVRTAWRVSPSAPLRRDRAMRLGDDDELAVLITRCTEQVRRGHSMIVVAFDDIDTELDAAARSRFGHEAHPLAAAQAHVVNHVITAMAELDASVIVCPTHYWGVTGSRYRSEFGRLVADGVPMWWTGPSVCSTTITAEQAKTVAEQYQHPLWIWDNYPVNDWGASEAVRWLAPGLSNEQIPARLLAGPLARRDPALAGVVQGYGCNGGSGAAISRLVMRTALQFCADPQRYDPVAALVGALDAEGVAVEAFRRVLTELGTTPVAAPHSALESVCARQLATSAAEARLTATDDRALADLDRAVDRLRADGGEVVTEITPWLDELTWVSAAVRIATQLVAAWSEASAGRVAELVGELRALPRAPLPARPLVASGAADAVVNRALGLCGSTPPPWPDA